MSVRYTTPKRCVCGERYDRFRSGHTFASVRAEMVVATEDTSQWRQKRRGGVLGYWRELKLAAWNLKHGNCPAHVTVMIGGIEAPFGTRAAADSFARARARLARRPIVTEVRIGDTVIARYRGDWHGSVRTVEVDLDAEPSGAEPSEAGDASFDVDAMEAAS